MSNDNKKEELKNYVQLFIVLRNQEDFGPEEDFLKPDFYPEQVTGNIQKLQELMLDHKWKRFEEAESFILRHISSISKELNLYQSDTYSTIDYLIQEFKLKIK